MRRTGIKCSDRLLVVITICQLRFDVSAQRQKKLRKFEKVFRDLLARLNALANDAVSVASRCQYDWKTAQFVFTGGLPYNESALPLNKAYTMPQPDECDRMRNAFM